MYICRRKNIIVSMPLKCFFKASDISNLSDARYFSAYEVDWLGFNRNRNAETFLLPQTLHEISSWVSGPKVCAEFIGCSVEDIAADLEAMSFDGIELEMDNEFQAVGSAGLVTFRRLFVETDSISELQTKLNNCTGADYFILDFRNAGLGAKFILENAELLKSVCKRFPCVFDVALSGDDVSSILNKLHPLGYNFPGGLEQKVGLKSFDDIQDVIESLETWG